MDYLNPVFAIVAGSILFIAWAAWIVKDDLKMMRKDHF